MSDRQPHPQRDTDRHSAGSRLAAAALPSLRLVPEKGDGLPGLTRAAQAVRAGRLAIRSDRRGTAHVIAVSGELDLATARVLADELDAVLATDAQLIDLDLSGLTFVALIGLHVVAEARARAAARGCRPEVRRLETHVQRIVELTASLDAATSAA